MQYSSPDGLVALFHYFDNDLSQTLIGEYAAYHVNNGSHPLYPQWIGSVGEAVFLIGGERNADRVMGASYAPTLMNINSWQWDPDMIEFDANPADTTRSTSWYMVQLMNSVHITQTLPVTANVNQGPLYYVAGQDAAGEFVVKMANYNGTIAGTGGIPVAVTAEGVAAGGRAQLTMLTSNSGPTASNVPGVKGNVVKTTKKMLTADKSGAFSFFVPNLAVALLQTIA